MYESVLFARFARNHKLDYCSLNVLYVFKDEEDEAAIARKSELAQHMVDMKERLLVEEKMLRAKEEAFLIGKHLYQFMLNQLYHISKQSLCYSSLITIMYEKGSY